MAISWMENPTDKDRLQRQLFTRATSLQSRAAGGGEVARPSSLEIEPLDLYLNDDSKTRNHDALLPHV